MSESASIASLESKRALSRDSNAASSDRLRRLEMRVAREHAARHEAERLLESKSLELFELNRQLSTLNAELEQRVWARTAELDQQRQLAEKLVATDYLTNVSSRACYVQHLEASLREAKLVGSRVGLLLIDIDQFKQINDSLGHVLGDDLLIHIARRLQETSLPDEMVARLGGDEFAVVFPCKDEKTALRTAERFRAVFQEPFLASGMTVRSSGSVGLAVYPDHASSAAELQQFTDLALYKAKATHPGTMSVFDRTLLERFETRRRLELELRQAVESGQIDVWYQPIVEVSTGRVEAVEALARWQDSKGNFISPELFIPLAEDCDVIQSLGRFVLAKSCRAAKKWIDSGRVQSLTVNLSAIQMQDEGIADDVLQALQRANLHPRHLIIEITERLFLEETVDVLKTIERLDSEGITFALDDFGSGYSNLRQLRLRPISTLKIDRSLLPGIEGNRKAQIIYENIVTLSSDLGLRTVSEGVEKREHLDFIHSIGCDLAQGYFLGRPVPADKLQERLTSAAICDDRNPSIAKNRESAKLLRR